MTKQFLTKSFYNTKNYSSVKDNYYNHIEQPSIGNDKSNYLIKVLLIGPIITYLVYELIMIMLYKPSIAALIYEVGVELATAGTVYCLYVFCLIYIIATYENKKIIKIFKKLLSLCFLSFFTVFLMPYMSAYIPTPDDLLSYNNLLRLNADQFEQLWGYIIHIKSTFMITIIICAKQASPYFFLLADTYIKFIDLIVYYIPDIHLEETLNTKKFGPLIFSFDFKYDVYTILLFLPLILLIRQIISLLYNIIKK
jgi:hypothetical protein